MRRATTINVFSNSSFSTFLSTLSLRRATSGKSRPFASISDHFYPRSPCGERLRLERRCVQQGNISIHALLAESDSNITMSGKSSYVFLSTLSLRRATCAVLRDVVEAVKFLSTLSLRRATVQNRFVQGRLRHFYPRSPCGERPTRPRPAAAPRKFLSTFSLRRATDANHCNVWLSNISIHALLAESDRPAKWLDIHRVHISIHALLAESDTRKAP